MPYDPENAHRVREYSNTPLRKYWPKWLPSLPNPKPKPRSRKGYPSNVVDIVTSCDIILDYFGDGERPMVCHVVHGVTGQSFPTLEAAAMAAARYIYTHTEKYGPEWGCVFGETPEGTVMPSVLVTQNLIGSMGSCLIRLETLMSWPVLGAIHSHPGRKGMTYSRTGPSDGDQMTADSVAAGYDRDYYSVTVDLPTGNVEYYIGRKGRDWEKNRRGLYVPVGHAPENIRFGNVADLMA